MKSSNECFARIPLEGTINTRDMGGIPTRDGHYLRHGLAFRSDALNRLTPRDIAFWVSQGLRLDIDVRSEREQKQFPDVEIPNVVHGSFEIQHEVDEDHILKEAIHPKTFPDLKDPYFLDVLPFLYRYDPNGDMHQGFPRMYALMPLDPTTQKHLHQAFSLLSKEKATFVVHCKDGKDRTGFFCYLFLSLLGVSYENILSDYLLSKPNEERRAREMQKQAKTAGIDDPLILESIYWMNTVDETNLNALDASLKRHYGSVEEYLLHQIGLTKEEILSLRSYYLK